MALTPDDKNKLLAELNKIKFPGAGDDSLLKAVAATMINKGVPNADGNNAKQIEFAKWVWNHTPVNKRMLFKPRGNEAFLRLAADSDFTHIIKEALEVFERGPGTGDAKKAADYQEIKKRYNDLKVKQNAETAFTENLTHRENEFVKKFEATATRTVENHKPNEQAVVYVYILAKTMDKIGVLKHVTDTIEAGKQQDVLLKIMKDILQFISVHGDKTFESFKKAVSKWISYSIIGPSSGEEINTFLNKCIDPSIVKSADASTVTKYVDNHEITLKRLYRCVDIFTTHATVWALMGKTSIEFKVNMIKLYDIENQLKQDDKISLSIVWYLCIGRRFMNCVMTDHHELSANNVLAKLLGKPGKTDLAMAPHAFPFDKPNDEEF